MVPGSAMVLCLVMTIQMSREIDRQVHSRWVSGQVTRQMVMTGSFRTNSSFKEGYGTERFSWHGDRTPPYPVVPHTESSSKPFPCVPLQCRSRTHGRAGECLANEYLGEWMGKQVGVHTNRTA